MPAPITGPLMDMAPDTVIVERATSVDEYGAVTYGASETFTHTRVIGRTKMVLDPDGQEKLSGATVVFFGEFGFSLLDRFTLPVRFSMNQLDPNDLAARQPKPLNIDRETDENGAHHTTVYFSVARLRGY